MSRRTTKQRRAANCRRQVQAAMAHWRLRQEYYIHLRGMTKWLYHLGAKDFASEYDAMYEAYFRR